MVIGQLAQPSGSRRIEIRFNENADAQAATACLRAIGYQPVRVDLRTFDVAIEFSLSDGSPATPKLVKRRELPTRRIIIRELPAKNSETATTSADSIP